MQNHPGSWYLPWGVGMPLQKMLALPFQHPGAAAAAAAAGTSNVQANPVTCAVLSAPQTQQHSPSSMQNLSNISSMQTAQAPQHYQHPSLHATVNAAQLPVGSYNCPNTNQTLTHAHAHATHNPLLGNNSAAAHAAHLQNQQALHQAAAAMFTPMSLRNFLNSGGNPLAALTPHQSPLTPPCGSMHHAQTPGVVSAAAAAAAAAQAAVQQQMSCVPASVSPHHQQQHQLQAAGMNLNVGVVAMRHQTTNGGYNNGCTSSILSLPIKKPLVSATGEKDKLKSSYPEKRKAEDSDLIKDLKKAKLETKALKAKRPGFTDERYYETSYYIENGLRKVYPYYFTFTTFTKGRWVGEKILDVFAREFRAHPAEEYERCIKAGTLTVNYDKVPIDYRLKHNDLLANIVHRHEVPVTSQPITIVHMDDDIVVVNKPASIPVHPCGRYRHNTVVFILAKEYNLKNLRTIHRLDRLTSGLLLFGRSPKKARQMEHQIRNRQVQKEYICRVEGDFPEGLIECNEPIEVVSYKIGVCKVSAKGKDCTTTFRKIAHNGKTSVVLCKPLTGRMHQIRVHLQYLGYPVVNDPLYNHEVFGPLKGKGGDIGGKTDEELVRDLINIHNAENWLGIDGDNDMSSMFQVKADCETETLSLGSQTKNNLLSDDDSESVSRETSPCSESPRPAVTDLTDNESNAENNNNNAQLQTPTNVEAEVSTTTTTTNGNGLVSNNGNASPNAKVEVTVATQTGHEAPDMAFHASKMTTDKHCYECKVRYRDPKPKDLIMYLHAWKYKGPGWEYETELPNWANPDWKETDSE